MPGRVQTHGYMPKKYPVGFFGVDPRKKPAKETHQKKPPQLKSNFIGIGDGAGGTCPQIREKIFLVQLLCKIRAFFGQKSCKI